MGTSQSTSAHSSDAECFRQAFKKLFLIDTLNPVGFCLLLHYPYVYIVIFLYRTLGGFILYMSTLSLVLVVIAVAAAGMAALAFIRWREAKRLAYARLVVEYSDSIALLDNIGTELSSWVSAEMLRFIASTILAYHAKLQQLKAPGNKKIEAAVNNALYWSQVTTNSKQPLPGNPHTAQKLREAVRSLFTALKSGYKNRVIDGETIRVLLAEAKNLNLEIAVAVFQDKVVTADRMHNDAQALHYLKKAKKFLEDQQQLSGEFVATLADINAKIQKHSEQLENKKKEASSRLVEDTTKLSEEDDSWRKKRF